MIVGIDEVGRGAWAGPLVVGAVVLGGKKIKGLADSKKLTLRQRQFLDKEIRRVAVGYSLGWVSAVEIDEIGLTLALGLATKRALMNIRVPYDEIIIDGRVNFLANTKWADLVTNIVKADSIIPSVSAASIIAKVARDKYMSECLGDEASYNFCNNVGYGTKSHQLALESLGPTSLHRLSFKPIKDKLVSISGVDSSGQLAERYVCQYLVGEGYQIITRNWRHQLCEVDIIAKKDGLLFFIEVKHRLHKHISSGIDAINNHKIKQLKLAAELYGHLNNSTEDIKLIAISTTNNPIAIDEIYEIE